MDSRKKSKVQSKGKFRKFIKTPKAYLLGILLALTAVFVMGTNNQKIIDHVAIAAATAVIVDFFIMILLRRKLKFPVGGLLTGMIVGLVLSAFVPWYMTAITSLLSVLSKHVLKVKRTPVFNPAAFGLYISVLLFSSMQDWWGALSVLPVWTIIFVLIGGFIITNRVKKFPQVLSFLGFFFIILLVLGIYKYGNIHGLYQTPLINSTLFLSFFMLTDPPTSPAKTFQQVQFGFIAAVVCVGVYLLGGSLTYLLAGLLVANAWNVRKQTKKQRVEKTKVFYS